MSRKDKKKAIGPTGQQFVTEGGSQLPTPRPESTPLATESSIQNNESSESPEPSNSKSKPIPKVITVPPTSEMVEATEAMRVMSANVGSMTKALETIQSQALWLSTYHHSLKLQEEINKVKTDLEKQVHQEVADIKQKRHDLEKQINAPVPEDILEGWTERIREIVQNQVSAKVEQELRQQIPETARVQAKNHQDQMQELQNHLYNDEIKRRNALIRAENEPLGRLRIPKAVAMSRSSSGSQGSGITPATTGYPQTPSNGLQLLVDTSVPAVNDDLLVSPAFPYSIEQLYGYYKSDRGKLRQLLNDYGEDVQDARNDQQAVDQLNKALDIVGVCGIKASVPPPSTRPPLRRPVGQYTSRDNNSILSPLMIHTLTH